MSPNVLITAGSRRVPLVQAFQRALRQAGGGRVIVTDVNPLSPAVHAADAAFRVSLASEAPYIQEILHIATAQRVNLVVPTIDDELPLFSAAIPRFAEAGIRVAVSPFSSTLLCNDKYATCWTLRQQGVAAARSYLPATLPTEPAFPLFVKPRWGRGGVGAFAIQDPRQLAFFLDYVPQAMVQEYLEGPEFTIDMMCDFTGRPLSIVPRERVVIRAGVIDRGRTVKDPALFALAEACAAVVPFAGAVNIQCRVVEGRPIVFEINPRFSGGIPLTIEAGADFPAMLIRLAAGHAVPPSIGRFRDNLWMTNYETSVFLDGASVALERYDDRRAVVGEVA